MNFCAAEYHACRQSFSYFAHHYCCILAEVSGGGEWIPFRLWPLQRLVAEAGQIYRLLIVLKARQVGLTWLFLCFALWLVLFHPIATVLLFSRRDTEAVDLLRRLRGIYRHLPPWLQLSTALGTLGPKDNDHAWELANGSRVLAFPSGAGDSYTASLAIVDEADLCDLDRLMPAVKPTIDGGGRMVLLSRADTSRPQSQFKLIYQAARRGANGWHPVFLPWSARPDRDAGWYAAQEADILARTGSLDDLHEQYPATDMEALAPRTMDKRIPAAWLNQCYREQQPAVDLPAEAPSIPGMMVYRLPVPDRRYVLGADPAEGNPTSDDSALTVLDAASGEEVCCLAGKFEPAVFAAHIDRIGRWYNNAPAMIERNNHGHAVLLWLADNSPLDTLPGHDGRPGWLSSSRGKAMLYDAAADAFRNRETLLHSTATYVQLAGIEGSTLLAPEGQHDDLADSYAFALATLVYARAGVMVEPAAVVLRG